MAITNGAVKEIQRTTVDVGELIHSLCPVTIAEWKAFEKLVDAHKALRGIDTDSLLQIELIPSKPEAKTKPEVQPDQVPEPSSIGA